MCDVVVTKTLINNRVITDIKVFYNINANDYYNLVYNFISHPYTISSRRKGNKSFAKEM